MCVVFCVLNAWVKSFCHLLSSVAGSCFALIFVCLCGFIGDRLDFCWRCLGFRCLHFRFVFYWDLPEGESPNGTV